MFSSCPKINSCNPKALLRCDFILLPEQPWEVILISEVYRQINELRGLEATACQHHSGLGGQKTTRASDYLPAVLFHTVLQPHQGSPQKLETAWEWQRIKDGIVTGVVPSVGIRHHSFLEVSEALRLSENFYQVAACIIQSYNDPNCKANILSKTLHFLPLWIKSWPYD